MILSAGSNANEICRGPPRTRQKLSCWPEFSFFRVFKALTESFLCIGAGGNVEQKYYILIQGKGPSMQDSFWGKRQLFHRIGLYSNSKSAVAEAVAVVGDIW